MRPAPRVNRCLLDVYSGGSPALGHPRTIALDEFGEAFPVLSNHAARWQIEGEVCLLRDANLAASQIIESGSQPNLAACFFQTGGDRQDDGAAIAERVDAVRAEAMRGRPNDLCRGKVA